MSKNVITGSSVLDKILKGILATSDAARVTLGPKGRTVITESTYGSPKITKDGVGVVRSITLSDPEENIGCQMVKDVASATVDAAGDGTTTATVLFAEIFERAYSLYKAGVSPTDLREGIRFGASKVIDYLKEHAQHISMDQQKILQVATIAANGDTRIGQLIADMIREVGQDGIITVEDGKSIETTSEKVEGMKFDQGFRSNCFVNNQQKQVCEFENVHILVYDKKLDSAQQAQQLAEIFEKYVRNEPLLVIAEDILDPVLPLFVINSVRQFIKVCAVKTPGFGDTRNAIAEDIAIFTGATYITETMGRSLENFQPSYLGKAKKIIVDSKSTTIISGNGNPVEIDDRCNVLKAQWAKETSEYAKGKLEDRIAKLKGKAGILHVGGTTEAEQKELKDRVEDAVQAVKAAISSGILPGGGSPYIRASVMLGKLINEMRQKGKDFTDPNHPDLRCTPDLIWGVSVIEGALHAPLKQSLSNAGLQDKWQTIIAKIQESDDTSFGYDVANNAFCNMTSSGIVDAAECSIAAIKNAGYRAAILIGSGAVITNKPEPKEPQPNGMGY